MKINYKKSLKLITLLITSLLIATVSAQSYRFLYIEGSVSISTTTGLIWVEGDSGDTGDSDVTITGSTAAVTLAISNGTIANFTHYLYLKNLDGSGHTLMINITDAASTSLYETNGFNMTIYNNSTGAYIDSLDVLSTASYYSGTVDASVVWHVTFEIATQTDATGSDNFNVQFRYE